MNEPTDAEIVERIDLIATLAQQHGEIDEITALFIAREGRVPVEGDFFTQPSETLDSGERIVPCWDFMSGRWEGFISHLPPKR